MEPKSPTADSVAASSGKKKSSQHNSSGSPQPTSPKKRKHHNSSQTPDESVRSSSASHVEEEKDKIDAATSSGASSKPRVHSPASSTTLDTSTLDSIRLTKRMKMIRELMATEETHAESLKTVVVEYLQPLRAILSKDQIKKLFGNIEVIMGWNMQFLNRLKLRQEESEAGDDDGMYFGDVMAEMMVIMRQLYSQYNENYEEAQQTYRDCLKNKDFEQFVQNKSIQNQKANLLNALYLPIGRMIVYDSLLREIISLTPKDHADYEDLCNALKLVIAATKQADRVVEKRKNMEIVLRIQSQLTGADIAEPHRRYVYEGDVMIVIGKQQKERKLFLFSDIILAVKLKKKKYEVDFKFNLKSLKVVDIEEEHRLFKLIDSDNTEIVIHSEDKQTWLELLNSTIKKMSMTPQELKSLKDEDEGSYVGGSPSLSGSRDLTRERLVELILSWSTMKADDVLSGVREVAALLKSEGKAL